MVVCLSCHYDPPAILTHSPILRYTDAVSQLMHAAAAHTVSVGGGVVDEDEEERRLEMEEQAAIAREEVLLE